MCTYCSKIVLTYLNSSDINSDLKSDLQALQNDLAKKFQFQSEDGGTFAQESSSPQRKISVGYQEERLLSQPKFLLSNADRKNILQQSTSLKVLYEDVCKALPNQNPGSDIIHYLITRNKSSNKSQAIAILTAMIEAGYIIEVDVAGIHPSASTAAMGAASPATSRPLNLYLDENDDGNNSSSENPTSDSDILHEFNEHAYYKLLRTSEIMSNSGTFNLNLDVDNTSVHLSKPETCNSGWATNHSKNCFIFRFEYSLISFALLLSLQALTVWHIILKDLRWLRLVNRTSKKRSFQLLVLRAYRRHSANTKIYY